MNKIVLIGAGGHARSCIDVIESSGDFIIAGFIDNNSNYDDILGYPIIGDDDDLPKIRQSYENAFITLGQIKDFQKRMNLFQLLNKLGFTLPTIISPRAYVSKNAIIGKGTIVMHDALVNSNVQIGTNCIINSKSLIEHDSIIGDNCHISTGAIVNGNVIIGNRSFLGSGAVTKECIKIGNNCVIGSGANIKFDIESDLIIKK